RRGGVNLQPEVGPQRTERPPRDSPVEDTPDTRSGAELNIQADRAGSSAFREVKSSSPARPLSWGVRVRHEVAGGIVTVSCHQRFCPLYPIGTCVAGNGGVRSSRDNVSSPQRGGRESVSRHGDCQHQGGRGLGLGGRVNPGEASVNVVTKDK